MPVEYNSTQIKGTENQLVEKYLENNCHPACGIL